MGRQNCSPPRERRDLFPAPAPAPWGRHKSGTGLPSDGNPPRSRVVPPRWGLMACGALFPRLTPLSLPTSYPCCIFMSRRDMLRIAQRFIAGKGGLVDGEVPLGTAEVLVQATGHPSLRDSTMKPNLLPSNELLGYSRSVPTGRGTQPHLRKMWVTTRADAAGYKSSAPNNGACRGMDGTSPPAGTWPDLCEEAILSRVSDHEIGMRTGFQI